MIGQPLPEVFGGAICRTVDPDLWFSPNAEDRQTAMKFCQRCPALEACRELGKTEVWGIWGGRPAGGRRNLDTVLANNLRRDANRDQTVTFTAHDAPLEQAS